MSPHTPPAELISRAMRFRMHNAGNFSRKVVVVGGGGGRGGGVEKENK